MEIANNELIEIFVNRCHIYCNEFCTDFDEATKYIYNGKTYIIYKTDLPYIEKLIKIVSVNNHENNN